MHRGSCSGYFWLSIPGASLRDLLSGAPALVSGRVVAITSFDSGPLKLSESELAAGWHIRDAVAISPPGFDIDALPREQFDEWYIFDGEVPSLSQLEIFVNYGSFSLVPPDLIRPAQDPTWDKVGGCPSSR